MTRPLRGRLQGENALIEMGSGKPRAGFQGKMRRSEVTYATSMGFPKAAGKDVWRSEKERE
jgi:hypothetical protein